MFNLNQIATLLNDPNIQRVLTDLGVPVVDYLYKETQKWWDNRQTANQQAQQWSYYDPYPDQYSSLKAILAPTQYPSQNSSEKGLNTPIGELFDDPKAKAILDARLPGLSTDPLAAVMRGMTLNTMLSIPQTSIFFNLTKEKAEALLAEINKNI